MTIPSGFGASDEIECNRCPFAKSGPGKKLAQALRPGRMREIKRAVASGATFWCHKTTVDEGWDEEDGDYYAQGRERVCGGSLRWLREHMS